MGLRWSYEGELPAPQLLLHAIRLTAHRRSQGRLSDTTDAAPYKSIKVVQCDQTSVFASSRMLRSEEVIRPLQRSVQLPLIGEGHMSTILIIILVLFLLGGGGWGYSRWRR
jgi:hypothetical protein